MAELIPKKQKFRCIQKGNKGKIKGLATSGYTVAQGDYGMKAMEAMRLTSKQIETMRKEIVKITQKAGKLFIRPFPHKPITRKPAETRMGGGKGSTEYWVAIIYPGTILFELSGVSESVAEQAFQQATYKIRITTKLVKKEKLSWCNKEIVPAVEELEKESVLCH